MDYISHFKKISESTALPIIIYNIPGRSIVDMSIETMQQLSKLDNINGVKDATNDLFRPLLSRTEIKKDFCYLSGEDGTSLFLFCLKEDKDASRLLPMLLQNFVLNFKIIGLIKIMISEAQEINLKIS